MAEARSSQQWAHTAAVLALLANAHRDPKKIRPFTPADFHPHLRRKEPVAAKVGIAVLKQVFVDRPGV
jgi:hypothetical protein